MGKEKNRGGALTLVSRRTLPFKRAHIEIKRDPYIPLSWKKKTHLTNIYVAPKNSKEVNDDHFSPDVWPFKKRHNPGWAQCSFLSLGQQHQQRMPVWAEKIEDWLVRSAMAYLNDGKPTHFNSTGGEAAPFTSFLHLSLLSLVISILEDNKEAWFWSPNK